MVPVGRNGDASLLYRSAAHGNGQVSDVGVCPGARVRLCTLA